MLRGFSLQREETQSGREKKGNCVEGELGGKREREKQTQIRRFGHGDSGLEESDGEEHSFLLLTERSSISFFSPFPLSSIVASLNSLLPPRFFLLPYFFSLFLGSDKDLGESRGD